MSPPTSPAPPRRRRGCLGRPTRLAVGPLLAAILVAGVGSAAAAAPAASSTGATGSSYQVSLITGDQVQVQRSPHGWRAQPDPAAADRGARFHRYEQDGQLYVIPSDAAPLVPNER